MAPPAATKPVPLLPASGFDDGHGFVIPGASWAHATPASQDFSAVRLEVLRAFLKTHQTDAMMVISHGRVVFEYGDIGLVSTVASVRKSMLDLLFAVEMQKGLKCLKFFDFADQSVVQLDLEDTAPFLESETHATLQQLMAARSGIYLTSGNTDQDKISPRRGTFYPGTHFFYNNWDFNAAGLAFEKLTHHDIFDALRDDLAIPLRFEDFDRARQKKEVAVGSAHPVYNTSLSTRDMARLGLFALRSGNWGTVQWGDAGLIQFSAYPTTHANEVGDGYWSPGSTGRWGYGLLWWVWDAPKYPSNVMTGPYQGAFSAMGSGGQYITIFPFYDLVVVHKVNIDRDENRAVSGDAWMTILNMVLDARCGDPAKSKSCG